MLVFRGVASVSNRRFSQNVFADAAEVYMLTLWGQGNQPIQSSMCVDPVEQDKVVAVNHWIFFDVL